MCQQVCDDVIMTSRDISENPIPLSDLYSETWIVGSREKENLNKHVGVGT